MKSWLKIASLGLVIGSVAVACTISEGDPDDDGIGGANTGEGGEGGEGGDEGDAGADTGGGSATGGSATGGSTTGGSATTGGAETGGSSGSGTGGTEPEDNPCVDCMLANCEAELTACSETADTIGWDPETGEVTAGPNNTPDCIDEFVSYQSCIEVAYEQDELYYNEADCDSAAMLVDYETYPLPETNVLLNCVLDPEGAAGVDCITECLDYSEDIGAGGAGG